MTGYTKLFSSIITSTIWREDDPTRIVWITMLALRDSNHRVEGSVPGLADVARVSVAACRRAIAKLSAPDPDSRSRECEGRRIMPLEDGSGWLIVNGEKYRQKMNADQRREYLRVKQAEWRAKNKPSKAMQQSCLPSERPVNSVSTKVNTRQRVSTQTEAKEKAEAYSDSSTKNRPTRGVAATGPLKFPCREGKTWTLTRSKLQEFQTTFKKLDVAEHARLAWQWARDNPQKRPSAEGMPDFLRRWMKRASAESESPTRSRTAQRRDEIEQFRTGAHR